MNYNNPIPVATCLIELEGPRRLLVGVVRGIPPGHGGRALPGGYIDSLESVESALAREAFEEIGLRTNAQDWELVCSRISPENRLLIFGRLKHKLPADWVAKEARPCAREVLSVCELSKESELVFPLHQEVLAHYLGSPSS